MNILKKISHTTKTFLHDGTGTEKKLFGFFSFAIISLFFYSFTQVDLSLTLSRVSAWQGIQKAFQYIGYFNRPLSSLLYILLLTLLFGFFIFTLILIFRKKVGKTAVFCMIGLSVVILTFTYNAFSYDLFNYIFDAKIITHYHQIPYEHKALDYMGDPMLSFMRWTHRVYPYGPSWLLLTVPLSFIGMQYFVVTFFLFKFFITACFVGSVVFLYKILQKVSPQIALFGTALFALNPLVLIESLVSAHNDIVVLFFVLFGLCSLIQKKPIVAFLIFVFAYGIKFATADLPFNLNPLFVHVVALLLIGLGVLLFMRLVRHDREKSYYQLIFVVLFFMITTSILATYRTTFQPWYILSFLPFASFFIRRLSVVVMVIVLSAASLLNYLPYLYLGNWDPPVPLVLNTINIVGLVLAGLLGVIFYKKKLYE